MWRHAVVDDPKNGVLVMMLAQSLFASGKFDEAAGATQQAMMLLKEDDWGVVIKNYRELYTKIGDYTTQLRALEKARKDKPDEPALRFLLGFHYAYLGFPKEAQVELAKATSLAPQDELSGRLKDILAGKDKQTTTTKVVPTPPEPALPEDIPAKGN
jgi:tetratricopeptide (TPR) repeat protein